MPQPPFSSIFPTPNTLTLGSRQIYPYPTTASTMHNIQNSKALWDGATGNVVLFFRPSKTTFRRVLQNQILIENDNENGDNFDA